MDIKIIPSSVRGNVSAISSKSYAHRMLIAAALSDKPVSMEINILSEDISATMICLQSLGSKIQVIEFERGYTVTVHPIGVERQGHPLLDCKESGSTARFLLPLAAHLFHSFTMTGQGKLPQRPFSPLCREMKRYGCSFDQENLPMTVEGRLQAGTYEIEGNISSQYISGLLFALPLLYGESKIILKSPLESIDYVKMTLEILSLFQIKVECIDGGYYVPGNQRYISPSQGTVQGDWSNGAFFLCMGALAGPVSVKNLLQSSLQGDKEIMEILSRFGAEVHWESDLATVASEQGKNFVENLQRTESDLATVTSAPLSAIEIDVKHTPDLVPCLAAVASVSRGKTVIYNGERLKLKESNRIETTYKALTALGAQMEMTSDGLIIYGQEKLRGGTAEGFNDHRIVMAAAVASCACENPVIIKGAEAVNKSYPTFWKDFQKIGGNYHVIGNGK